MSVTICPTVPRCHGSYLSQQDVTSLPTVLHPKPKTCRGSESQPQLDSVRAWWGGLHKWGWIGFKCCTNTTQNFSLLCKAEKKSKSESVSHWVVSDSLGPQGLYLSRLLCPWNSPDKNTGEGCHFLLQGIFLIQGSNLHLLHWQAGSLPSKPPENIITRY